jgi:hypothetical protein
MKKILHVMIGMLFFLGSYNIVLAQTFVGSESCSGCHPDKYGDWVASGHPYKFTVIENGQAPVYPVESINFQSQWMENLGDGSHDWDVVAGVIGGYGWKARFVGNDGHIMGTAGSAYSTGLGHNQFNFYDGENHGWVDYEAGNDAKIYNYGCFKCHTTGGDTTGTWLDGVEGLGTFTEGGVGCESCHGPGSDHIADPTLLNIDKVYEFAHQDNAIGGLQVGDDIQTPDPDGDDINFLCGTCHNRSYTDPINSNGGFIKHHEQWDELTATKHNEVGFTCVTCHDPHKRVIWDGDGITITCATCHSDQADIVNHGPGATCIDCHMPYAAKSGTTRGESGYKGDVRSHLFTINTDTASMFVLDGSVVKDDDEREAALSPHFACLGCHNDDPNDDIPELLIGEASEAAAGMHVESGIAKLNISNLGLYPNPSQGPTKITFTLFNSSEVSLKIFSATGQLVYGISDIRSAGNQVMTWNGTSNTGTAVGSGYYFVKISVGDQVSVQKLVLMK